MQSAARGRLRRLPPLRRRSRVRRALRFAPRQLALPALHGRAAAARHRRQRHRAQGRRVARADRVDRRGGAAVRISAGVPGMYNAYNVLATDGSRDRARRAAGRSSSARWPSSSRPSGGSSGSKLAGRTITLALVKNPVGFNEVLRMLTMATDGLSVPTMIVINDRHADGRDVSWLWDVDFELLADGAAPLTTAGIRGTDMANRLKYAGVPDDRIRSLDPDPGAAIDLFVASIPEGGRGYILADVHRHARSPRQPGRAGRRRAVLGAIAMSMTFTIGWLYPTKMNIYGDRGNVIALKRRAALARSLRASGRDRHRRPGPGRHRRLLLWRRPGRAAGRRLARSAGRQGRGDQGRDRERRRRCSPSAAAISSSAMSTARTRPIRCPVSACSMSSASPVPSGSSATSSSRVNGAIWSASRITPA